MAVMKKGMAAALVTAEVLFLLLLSVLAAILNLFIFLKHCFFRSKNDRFAESRRPFRNCWNACSGSSF